MYRHTCMCLTHSYTWTIDLCSPISTIFDGSIRSTTDFHHRSGQQQKVIRFERIFIMIHAAFSKWQNFVFHSNHGRCFANIRFRICQHMLASDGPIKVPNNMNSTLGLSITKSLIHIASKQTESIKNHIKTLWFKIYQKLIIRIIRFKNKQINQF